MKNRILILFNTIKAEKICLYNKYVIPLRRKNYRNEVE
jgi:hypothetical protein